MLSMLFRIRGRHPEFTMLITVILLCLFGLWKLRNFLWRRRHCEIVTGAILKAEEIGRTVDFVRYRLTIEYTDSNGETETVQLLTCNSEAASAETTELSIISRTHLRKGRGYQSLLPDERVQLRLDETTRSQLEQINRTTEDLDLTDRRWDLLNLLLCPALYVERARFADPKAHREPKKRTPLTKLLMDLLIFLVLLIVGIMALFYLMGTTEGIL